MRVIGIIPSRYASTRFPGKPLYMIKGKTMIQRVWEQACKSNLDTVVVATDDMRIAEEVLKFGGQYVMTNPNLRSGTDRCREALYMIEEQYDAVVNIQGDEPFINPAQINQVIEMIGHEDTQLASLAKRIEDEDELFSPSVVKVVMDKQGNALYFSRNPIPFMRNLDHDKWLQKGEFYKHIGLYAYKTETLCQIAEMQSAMIEMAESLEQLRWLANGLRIRMGITPYESLSFNTQEDLEKVLQYAQDQLKE